MNESGIRMLFVFVAIVLVGEIFIKVSENSSAIPQTITSIGDETQKTTSYVVKKGETLWEIAQDKLGNGQRWNEIANLNNIKDENIDEGQKIIIPTDNPDLALPTPTELNNPNNTISGSTEADIYTVAKGDTLWSIAENKYGSGYNWVDIASANKLTGNSVIEVGDELFMPNVNPKISTNSTRVSVPNQLNAINSIEYIVQKGDNLWSIAVRAYGDGYKWVEISKANNLQNPGLILPGQKLSIPR